MAKRSFLRDISASTLQMVINQFAGAVVFLVLSISLSKDDFGQLNWSLALLMVSFSIAGFGLEHLVVKKIATGADKAVLLRAYFTHALLAGVLLLLVFAWVSYTVPVSSGLFMLLTAAQFISFLCNPFRQLANGMERFRALMVMAIAGNLIKMLVLLAWQLLGVFDVKDVARIYIIASTIEFIICILVARFQLRLRLSRGLNWNVYVNLLREGLPVLGMTIFNTAVARIDWVLLGLLSGTTLVAGYSFANRFFELATLPLLIVAPVIFPKITRMFASAIISEKGIARLSLLIRLEIIGAVYVALATNICWASLADAVTGNKYGASTSNIMAVLSLGIPLVYINNAFWNILFSQGKMRPLFFIFMITFAVNFLADMLMIPAWQGTGAAAGFVLALGVQAALYLYFSPHFGVRKAMMSLLPVSVSAGIAAMTADLMHVTVLPELIVASIIYLSLLFALRQFRLSDWQAAKKILAA